MKEVRKSNFELMRIVAMFLIVIWHVIVHGGLLTKTDGPIQLLITLIFCLCAVHVNSFVLLCGYFQYDKEFSGKKFLKVFNAQWFYNAVIVIVFFILGWATLSKLEVLRYLEPFDYGNYWFVNTYLVLYMISPFLNKLIKYMNQKEHRKLLIINIILFTFIPFVTGNSTINNNGYTIVSFVFLYFLGAYLAKYPIKENIHFKNYSFYKRRFIFFFGMILFAVLNFVFGEFSNLLSNQGGEIFQDIMRKIASIEFHYSNLFIILQTICFFLFFETLEIKNKFINKISTLMFGVYLVHDNILMRNKLMNDIFSSINTPYLESKILFLLIIGYSFLIFIISAMIEYIRQVIFKFVENRKLSRRFSNRFWELVKNF